MKAAYRISILGLSAVLLAGSTAFAADAVRIPAADQVNKSAEAEVAGPWLDDGLSTKTQTVVVRALSDAYFRILELHPEVKEIFRLGSHLVWITPSNTVLVIDTSEGKERLSDEEIEKLFSIVRR